MMSQQVLEYAAKGAAIAAGLLLHMYWRKYLEKRDAWRAAEELRWNNTIFFPSRQRQRLAPEHPDSSISQLKRYLKGATKSISVCVMTIRQQDVSKRFLNLLIAKLTEGIKVKVYIGCCPSTIRTGRYLINNGIEVRYKKYDYVTTMHHKFIIIDGRFAITGSLNWSDDAFKNQKDNLLITSDSRIVPKYCQEFDRLWEIYDDDDVDVVISVSCD